ncbi:MAG TPA: IclR family transcriptional regulator [Trebonia sp.]
MSGTDGNGFVPVKSADRVLAILELLAAGHRRYSLSEIGQELDIPLSSLHGILRTMQRRRWLEVDETNTRFGIGPEALIVGSSYPRSDPLVARADVVLDWLSEQTGETVHYGRLEGSYIIYLAKRDSRYLLRIYTAVGKRIPAHAASLGKAILARCPEEEVRRILDWPLERLTPHTLATEADLFADFAAIRERGYSIELQESDLGLGCVAIAVPGASALSDALSITVPTARLDTGRIEELARLLLNARQMIEGSVGMPAEAAAPAGFLRNLD